MPVSMSGLRGWFGGGFRILTGCSTHAPAHPAPIARDSLRSPSLSSPPLGIERHPFFLGAVIRDPLQIWRAPLENNHRLCSAVSCPEPRLQVAALEKHFSLGVFSPRRIHRFNCGLSGCSLLRECFWRLHRTRRCWLYAFHDFGGILLSGICFSSCLKPARPFLPVSGCHDSLLLSYFFVGRGLLNESHGERLGECNWRCFSWTGIFALFPEVLAFSAPFNPLAFLSAQKLLAI
jgi:hypothetical protein